MLLPAATVLASASAANSRAVETLVLMVRAPPLLDRADGISADRADGISLERADVGSLKTASSRSPSDGLTRPSSSARAGARARR